MNNDSNTLVNDIPPANLDNSTVKSTRRVTLLVVCICWFAIFAEGYDLGIYGAVLPAIMADKQWSLSPAMAGAIGSYALFGMLIGAALVGTLTDLIGRKGTLILCITIFSITMALAAMASTPELFGMYRFVGGLALGGVVPTATALTIEYSPANRKTFIYALMFTGYSIGGVLGAILSIFLLEDFGWRFMFFIGVLPILIVPFIVKFLPESISFLLSKNRDSEAEKIAARYGLSLEEIKENEPIKNLNEKNKSVAVANLFKRQHIRTTLLFWITYFMGFLMIYGLNTWLPKIMSQAGYPMGSSLSFLLVLNFTAAIGSVLAGSAADRWGAKRVVSLSFFLASICLALLSIKSSILGVFILVGIAGFGSYGSVILMNAYISKFYPVDNRGTAIGWAHGFGRIGAVCGPLLGGMLLSWNINLAWYFYIFAIAGIVGTLCILFLREPQIDTK